MELNLRDRKRIINGALPKFEDGNLPEYLSNDSHSQTTSAYVPQWQNVPKQWNSDFQTVDGTYRVQPEIKIGTAQGVTPSSSFPKYDLNTLQNEKLPLRTTSSVVSSVTKPGTIGAGIANAAISTIGAISDVADAHSYNKSAENLLQESQRRTAYAGNIGYEWQDDPQYQRELDEIRRSNTMNTLKAAGSGAAAGAAIGSVVPVLGTVAGGVIGGALGAIGGLFGGASRSSKAKTALRQAQINAMVRNDFNRDNALTQYIRQRNAEEIGNSFANTYKYEDGRSPANAMVSNGETILNEDGSRFKVGVGKDNKDTVPIHLRDGQGVITNKYGLSDMAMYNPGLALNLQTMLKRNGMLKGYKNGKLPGFEGGLSPWTNIIPSAFGGIASIYQYFDAKNQSIKSPNVYASNPYAQDAFAAMNEIKNNPYPTLWQLRDAEARTKYALDQAGGLGSGQKMLARIAQQGLTQNAWAKSLADVQAYNNAQKMAVQNAKLQTGYQDATRRQQSNAFNEEYTAKSHAARQQGMQMGVYNFLNQLQGYYANEFKRRQFNDTMDLYRQQQKLDMDRFKAEFPDYDKPSTKTASSTTKYNVNGKLITPSLLYTPTKLGGNIGMYSTPQLTAPKPFYYPGATFKLDSYWTKPYLKR